jgi:phosphatidylserine/phosphatidylglycerophosphate/cardiolipin synthase-like enzyme
MPSTRPDDWFLPASETLLQPPFTSDNEVTALIDGRNYFAQLKLEIESLGQNGFIYAAGWRMTPRALLDPPNPTQFRDLLVSKLQSGVHVRALLWNVTATTNSFSVGHGPENLEIFNSINASPTGVAILDDRLPQGDFPAHHQKFFVLNENEPVAFVGGIDIALDRWDVQEHDEPAERASQEEFFKGWHDVQAMVKGPAVEQIWDSFNERWSDPRIPNLLVAQPNVPDISAERPSAAPAGHHHVQLLRTYACRSYALPPDGIPDPTTDFVYPFAPQGEYTYEAALVNAINRAELYVYLEDQYFWPCAVVDAIANAAARGVTIILVLQRTYDVQGLTPYHNFLRQQALQSVLDRIPDYMTPRLFVFHLLQERTIGQVEGDEIYVHAKTVIIDDCFAAIGSANTNSRSMTNDTEIGISVVDDATISATIKGAVHTVCQFARDYRRNLWNEHLGIDVDDPLDSDGAPRGFPTDVNHPVHHTHVHEVPEPRFCGPSFIRTAFMNPSLHCAP